MTRPRWFALGAVVVLAALAVAALRAPAWFAPPAADDPDVQRRGERLERAVTSEFTRVRAEEPTWAVRVREADVNAWLATRLVPWAEHADGVEWPAFVAGVQVHFTSAGAWIAVERAGGAPPRVAAIRLSPDVTDGRLRVPISAARVGRVPVPVNVVLGEWSAAWLDDATGAEVARFIEGEGAVIEHALADGRRVRLTGLDIGAGWLDLAFETVGASGEDPTADDVREPASGDGDADAVESRAD